MGYDYEEDQLIVTTEVFYLKINDGLCETLELDYTLPLEAPLIVM